VLVDRQNDAVPVGETMPTRMSVDSVVYATVAAFSGVTCSGTQPSSPRPSRVSRRRAPALRQTVEFCVSAGRLVMATVPDRQPFGTGVVGYTAGPAGLLVTRTGEAAVVRLGSELVAAGEVQATAATDSNPHTAASRAPVPPSGPISDHRPSLGLVTHSVANRLPSARTARDAEKPAARSWTSLRALRYANG